MNLYLFAVLHDSPPHLRKRRISNSPLPKDDETHISTIFDMPEDYFSITERQPGVQYDEAKFQD